MLKMERNGIGTPGIRYAAFMLAASLALSLGCARRSSNRPPNGATESTDAQSRPAASPNAKESAAVPKPRGKEQIADSSTSGRPAETAGPQQRRRPPQTHPSSVGDDHSLAAQASAKPWEPRVVMSHAHAATCLVQPQDKMPPIETVDWDGQPHDLESLLGNNLTVVVFWDAGGVFAREQYLRLDREVVAPFQKHGVQVVAINTGDPPATVRQLATPTAMKLINLLDVDGSALAKVATERLPRTYLLDNSGTILWMDIEYSRSTRRELHNALVYYLKLEG